jgi:hypothetical protein
LVVRQRIFDRGFVEVVAMVASEKQLITAAQAAEMVGFDPRTIPQVVGERSLPAPSPVWRRHPPPYSVSPV